MMEKFHFYLILSVLLLLPLVNATHNEEPEPQCSITNFGTCIAEKFYEFTLNLINAPFKPFLALTKSLLTEPVDIKKFLPIWAIIVYMLSLFYGIFVLFAGFNMIISGYSAAKRERAKEWLKNILLMIVFVQSSFLIYSLLIDISASMSSGIMDMIDDKFFLLTLDNLNNIALELFLGIAYLGILILTVLLLVLRYLLVFICVLFFPIGLFLNFIPPLKGYGKLIINFSILVLFIPFIISIILLGASKLVEMPFFADYKIVVMSASFLFIDLLLLFLALFVLVKAAFGIMNSDVGRAATMVYTRLPAAPARDKAQTTLTNH